MRSFANNARSGWRRLSPPCGLAILIGLALPCGAQPPAAALRSGEWEFRVAASPDVLWLAGLQGGRTRLARRTAASSAFEQGPLVNGRAALIAAANGYAYVFFRERWFYRYDRQADLRQTDLPGRQIPLDLVGADGVLYAIVPSASAAAIGRRAPATTGPATVPAPAAERAPLSIVKYNGSEWLPLTPCPAVVRADGPRRLGPRLCAAPGELLLVWASEQADRLSHARFDLTRRRWAATGTGGLGALRAFWAVALDGLPTLVTATADGPGESIRAYRLLRRSATAPARGWQPVSDLRFSPLPAGVTIERYAAAFGFNQHLGLLGADRAGVAYLRFARSGRSPLERTVRAAEVFTAGQAAQRRQTWMQLTTLAVMLGVLVGLFVFRRGAMVTTIALPAQYALPLSLQRLAAWLIDFVPFVWAGALMSRIPLLDGLRELAAWGLGTGADPGQLPRPILAWWAACCTLHAVYALALELAAQRTVGKVLTGTRVLSELGRRPAAWQLLVRNSLRLLELTPQFWVLALLVLLSRNRQRLGDIFARTLVVRRAPGSGGPAPERDDRAPPPGDSS